MSPAQRAAIQGMLAYFDSGNSVPVGAATIKADCAEVAALRAALAEPAAETTYTSTQATTCASCGEHKHTPLRIDKMGGYVCLTCIDQKLGSLLGEFGYRDETPAVEPVAVPEHWSDCATNNEPAYPAGACNCMPTYAMCRAAVEYVNGAGVYGKVPREALDIEEGIYREVWIAMQAASPTPPAEVPPAPARPGVFGYLDEQVRKDMAGFYEAFDRPPPPAPRPMSDREWAAQPANLREGCTKHVPGVGDL